MSDNSVYECMVDILSLIRDNANINDLVNERVSFVLGSTENEITAGELADETTTIRIGMNGETDIGRIAPEKVIPLTIRITFKGQGIVESNNLNVVDGIKDIEQIVFETKAAIIGSPMGEDLAVFAYTIDASGITFITATINLELRQQNDLGNN